MNMNAIKLLPKLFIPQPPSSLFYVNRRVHFLFPHLVPIDYLNVDHYRFPKLLPRFVGLILRLLLYCVPIIYDRR